MNNIYYIPRELIKETKEILMDFGRKDQEGFLLWKGIKISNNEFNVTGLTVPYQIARKTIWGYSFEVPPDSIREMQLKLANNKEIGLIQVHSHPGSSAIHSDADDTLCILSKKNALSVVLPYFGNIEFNDFSNCKVHIHTALYRWEVLSNNEVNKILRIIE